MSKNRRGPPRRPNNRRRRGKGQRPKGYAPKVGLEEFLLGHLVGDERTRHTLLNAYALGVDLEPVVRSAMVRALRLGHFGADQLSDRYRSGPYLCADRQLPGGPPVRPDLIANTSGTGSLPLAYELKVVCRTTPQRRGLAPAGAASRVFGDVEKLEGLIQSGGLQSGWAIVVAIGWRPADLTRMSRMAASTHRFKVAGGFLKPDLPIHVVAIAVRPQNRRAPRRA